MRRSLITLVTFLGLLVVSLVVFAFHPSNSSLATKPTSTVPIFCSCSTPVHSTCSDRDEFDFPSIAAHSSQELTTTVSGIEATDEVIVTPVGVPEAGLIWTGYLSDVDTVTLRLLNVTANAIDPVERKYRITVNKYGN
jgi:hypothetical protein